MKIYLNAAEINFILCIIFDFANDNTVDLSNIKKKQQPRQDITPKKMLK